MIKDIDILKELKLCCVKSKLERVAKNFSEQTETDYFKFGTTFSMILNCQIQVTLSCR